MGQNLGKVGICPMGDYASGKSYERLSSVFYNHEYWVAVKDVPVGAVPSATSEYWQKMASRGEQGPQGQSYVDKELVPIVDNLTTGGSSNVLSAEQGKVLKAELTELESQVVYNTPFILNDKLCKYFKELHIIGLQADVEYCVRNFYILTNDESKIAFAIGNSIKSVVSGVIDKKKGFFTFSQGEYEVLGILQRDDIDIRVVDNNDVLTYTINKELCSDINLSPIINGYYLHKSSDNIRTELTKSAEKLSVISMSSNLFNKNDDRNIKAYIVSSQYKYDDNYLSTHPIQVVKGITYRCPAGGGLGSNYNCAKCNEQGDYIETLIMTNVDGYNYITPDFYGWIRFNVGFANLSDTFMVCESDKYPSEYEPYGAQINAYIDSENIRGENPLRGKILAVDGDSICYGAGFLGGYAKIIADKNNMILQNLAVAGATLASNTYYSQADGGGARHWISTNVVNLRQDADYIIIEGGINDGELLGDMTNDYEGEFDSTTMLGALDTLFSSLYNRFPGKKIGFIIVHAVNENWSSYRDGFRYKAIIDSCKKWGIPYCDLNETCPPFGRLGASDNLRTLYTKNGDGWHPNEEGYRRYYVPKIETWLKGL